MTENNLNILANKLSELPEIIRSVILLGSFSDKTFNRHSDIDILIVTRSDLTAETSSLIGKKIRNATNGDDSEVSFNFYHPVCERCKLLSDIIYRYHFIVHPWSDIRNWIKEKDFIARMWAYKSNILWGDNPFNEKIIPEINKSLLDKWDGLPGFISEINKVLIAKAPDIDRYEYERFSKFYMDRISELSKFFPELSHKGRTPVNPEGKRGLIEISQYFSALHEKVIKIIDKISNNAIHSDGQNRDI